MHNLMRFTNIFWNFLIIIFVGLSSKELFNRSAKYFSQLIFVSSLGVLVPFHLFNSELITLSGFLILFYSFCLAPRRKNLSYFFWNIFIYHQFSQHTKLYYCIFICVLHHLLISNLQVRMVF